MASVHAVEGHFQKLDHADDLTAELSGEVYDASGDATKAD